MSLLLDIADAVVARLNAGVDAEAFSETFTPVRAFVAEFRKEDCASLQVRVIGISSDCTPGRDTSRFDVRVDVAIVQAADASDAETVEALIDLTDEIQSWMLSERFDDDHPADDCADADQTPSYDHDKLRTDGLFFGVVQLAYVRTKDRPEQIGDDSDVPLMLMTLPTPTGHLGIEDRLQLLGAAPYWEG